VAAAEASPYAQSVDAFCRSTEALIAHDSADRVAGIGAQTLITVGELDLVLPPRYSQELADRITNARLIVIPDVGHQPFQEVPGDYNDLLVDFWQSLA